MSCSSKKIVIQTPSNKLFIIPITNFLNLLGLKRKIQDKLYIQIDQQELMFCNELMNHNYQSIEIYHRYFHQKYDKCMYLLSVQLKLK